MKRLLVILTAVIAGCANPYAKFYQGTPDARVFPSYEQVQEDLKIYSTDNFDRDAMSLMQKGYSPIGQASFNAGANQGSEWQLREQARKVGAHVVLISSRYTNTVSGAVPLILPKTTTSHSTGTATAYGAGGIVSAYGSSTTTTQGTQTMVIPYSVARYDFGALFFAKTKPRVGIYPAPVDDESRKRLQTNAGIKVLVVAEGTSAFRADVLPGDIVLAIAGESVESSEHYGKLLDKYEGQTVSFKIDRDGVSLEKQIMIRRYKDGEEGTEGD
jgi:hypothetical protein